MENSSMKYISPGIIGVSILAVTLSTGYAENGYLGLGQGSQRIQVSADKVTGMPDARKIFEGNVSVLQGNIKLTCDKLIVAFDENKGSARIGGRDRKLSEDGPVDRGIKSFTASGNVKIVQDERVATAGKAFFDNVNRIITLTDSPRIWQGRDAAIAKAIVMYLDENTWEFQGGDNSPIKFTIHPSKLKNDKDKESSQKK